MGSASVLGLCFVACWFVSLYLFSRARVCVRVLVLVCFIVCSFAGLLACSILFASFLTRCVACASSSKAGAPKQNLGRRDCKLKAGVSGQY